MPAASVGIIEFCAMPAGMIKRKYNYFMADFDQLFFKN